LTVVYDDSRIGEPINYIRRQAPSKIKLPSSGGGIVIGSSHTSKKGPTETSS